MVASQASTRRKGLGWDIVKLNSFYFFIVAPTKAVNAKPAPKKDESSSDSSSGMSDYTILGWP